jgi:hypothetical protein
MVQETLGLVELYCGKDPAIDIIAVHGLGATADFAWIRKTDNGTVNWLSDPLMLPSQLPNSRVFTFNYESKWILEAPRQRRTLCAIQLLTALKDRPRDRPLIFIGHSFGGIVIEQALVSAINQGFEHVAIATAGILFLGTPHRGSAASKWGELIAKSMKNFGSEDRILKNLREGSEVLVDLLYEFSILVNRMSITVICGFEQHTTDYGKRYGFTWKEMVRKLLPHNLML